MVLSPEVVKLGVLHKMIHNLALGVVDVLADWLFVLAVRVELYLVAAMRAFDYLIARELLPVLKHHLVRFRQGVDVH